MDKGFKSKLFLLLVALAVTAVSAAPLFGAVDLGGSNAAVAGPACCRYSNECPGSETCGTTTGCSAGAPYECTGGAVLE